MTTSVPLWILYLQALSTPAIALLAAVIGYMQWRTNHQKIVIDMFDERLEVYRAIRDSIGPIMREGKANQQDFWNYAAAIDRATFLFGKEVTDYLDELKKTIIWLNLFRESLADVTHPDRQALIKKNFDSLMLIGNFFTSAPPLFAPYLHITQKMSRI